VRTGRHPSGLRRPAASEGRAVYDTHARIMAYTRGHPNSPLPTASEPHHRTRSGSATRHTCFRAIAQTHRNSIRDSGVGISFDAIESSLFGLPNGLAPAPTGLFGLGLGFGCRSKPKPGRSACKPVCRLGKPVCSLSRETGLRVLLVTNALLNWFECPHCVY
jgi:hypothetical protein